MIVHNPCNKHTRRQREYNLFWDELTDALKQKYSVTENRYCENVHDGITICINGKDIKIFECEYMIEYKDLFYVLSVADNLTGCILQENSKLKKVLISQFIDYQIKHHVKNIEIYSPWIYFKYSCIDLDVCYTNKISKMYFNGTKGSRPILNHFDKFLLECPDIKSQEEYFKEIVNYKVALSIGGVGELCYRDIECMALGVPLLRFQYQTSLFVPLIPNYHYISVNFDYTLPTENNIYKDRLGTRIHAKQLEDRFKEVVKDSEFLKFIAKNARQYYDDYLSPKVRVKHTLELLEL
jgi:hypothetical protein